MKTNDNDGKSNDNKDNNNNSNINKRLNLSLEYARKLHGFTLTCASLSSEETKLLRGGM